MHGRWFQATITLKSNTRSWNVSDSAESEYKVMKRVRFRRVRIQGHETCPTPPSPNTRSWNVSDSAESEYKVMKRVRLRRVWIQGHETCPTPPSPNTRSWNVSDPAESELFSFYQMLKKCFKKLIKYWLRGGTWLHGVNDTAELM